MTQLPREKQTQRERELHVRVCTDSTAVLSFCPSSYFVRFFRHIFLSFFFPSLLLTFGFCVLSTVNFSVYNKTFFAFVLHIQANFKLHASAMLGTALFQAIGLLCELLHIYLHRHTQHTYIRTDTRTYKHT